MIWYISTQYDIKYSREVYPYLVDGARDAAARGGVTHVAWVVRPGTIPGHLRGDIRRRRLAGLLLHARTNGERLEPFADNRRLYVDPLDQNDPDPSRGTCHGSDHLFLIERAIRAPEPPFSLSLFPSLLSQSSYLSSSFPRSAIDCICRTLCPRTCDNLHCLIAITHDCAKVRDWPRSPKKFISWEEKSADDSTNVARTLLLLREDTVI